MTAQNKSFFRNMYPGFWARPYLTCFESKV
jgi:hypothetical protein